MVSFYIHYLCGTTIKYLHKQKHFTSTVNLHRREIHKKKRLNLWSTTIHRDMVARIDAHFSTRKRVISNILHSLVK